MTICPNESAIGWVDWLNLSWLEERGAEQRQQFTDTKTVKMIPYSFTFFIDNVMANARFSTVKTWRLPIGPILNRLAFNGQQSDRTVTQR